MKKCMCVFVCCLALWGCSQDYSGLPQLIVDFKWPEKRIHLSPEITLGNMPAGAVQIEVSMFDLDNRYPHGGGSIDYNGSNTIAVGPLKNYEGPSPIYGAPRYEISVKALDSKGDVVAFGKKMKRFPPDEQG